MANPSSSEAVYVGVATVPNQHLHPRSAEKAFQMGTQVVRLGEVQKAVTFLKRKYDEWVMKNFEVASFHSSTIREEFEHWYDLGFESAKEIIKKERNTFVPPRWEMFEAIVKDNEITFPTYKGEGHTEVRTSTRIEKKLERRSGSEEEFEQWRGATFSNSGLEPGVRYGDREVAINTMETILAGHVPLPSFCGTRVVPEKQQLCCDVAFQSLMNKVGYEGPQFVHLPDVTVYTYELDPLL